MWVPARSAIWAATAVAAQEVPYSSGALGVSTNWLTPPRGLGSPPKATGVPVGHSSLNNDPASFEAYEHSKVTALPVWALPAAPLCPGGPAVGAGAVAKGNE